MGGCAVTAQQDIESLLSQWGEWARRTTNRLGYPTTTPISRMMEQAKPEPEIRLTARGKQSRVMTAPKIGYVDPQIMAVDRIVAHISGAHQKAIYRRYVFRQPDRIAAMDSGMSRDEYTTLANEAVEYVAEKWYLTRATAPA